MTRLSTTTKRKLFVHQAHDSVGVFGDGVALRPYSRIRQLHDDAGVAPLQITLAARGFDEEAFWALTLCEQAIQESCNARCRFLELADDDRVEEDKAECDCIVLFDRGLHIAQRWSDFGSLGPRQRETSERRPFEVEVASTARWHALAQGVEPFTASVHAILSRSMPTNACPILVGKKSDATCPVAWVCPNGHLGGVVTTLFGWAEDFRQPAFVQFVRNAITWMADQDELDTY